jgi:hypothetical protein
VSFVRTYTRPRVFAAAVLGSLVVGAAVGVLARTTGAGWLTDLLDQIGTIFTTLLQIAVIPLVFTAIVVGITSLRKLGGGRTAARLGGSRRRGTHRRRIVVVRLEIVGPIAAPGQPDERDRGHGEHLPMTHLLPLRKIRAPPSRNAMQRG